MNHRSTVQLHTGRAMPLLGLGTWQLTHDTAHTIAMAIKLGYRMIDTSGDYGTQPGIAEGIKQSGVDRSDLYVVTKVEETDDAYDATRKNLDELQLEYIDLMLIHRPPKTGAGEELWRGLLLAREEGLTKDIGVSNYPEELIQALIAATGEVPVANQIEWSPFGYSPAMVEYAGRYGMVIQAYSPLTRAQRLSDPPLPDIAAKHGKTPAQILLRWNLEVGTVPLPKANQPSHLKKNIDIFDFALDEDDMVALAKANQHYSSLGSLPYV